MPELPLRDQYAPLPYMPVWPKSPRDAQMPGSLLRNTVQGKGSQYVHPGMHADERTEELIGMSLTIPRDDRFGDIQKYVNNKEGSLIDHVKEANVEKQPVNLECTPVPMSFHDVAAMEITKNSAKQSARSIIEANSLAQRQKCQEMFHGSVRRLLVDFELSEVPSDRLHHLDRMHEWFKEQGPRTGPGDQSQIDRALPAFLTADRSHRSARPTGSILGMPKQLSPTALALAGSLSLCAKNSRAPSETPRKTPKTPSFVSKAHKKL